MIQLSPTVHSILIVEDQIAMLRVYKNILANQSLNLICVETGMDALNYLRQQTPSAILLDLGLPDLNGLEILHYVKRQQLSCSVIVVTCQDEVTTVVQAMQAGAFDYLEKPIKPERFQVTLRNALHQYELQNYLDSSQYSPIREHYHSLQGASQPMQLVYRIIDNVAASPVDVLITGETGTGKELCAEAIHKASPRAAHPFVVVNCAAIPENLLESHLFGHVKGAFTGATSHRKGAASMAEGGTLFLDEIGDLSWPLQSALLRFVQTKRIQKVGSDVEETIDVRIICATNRNLLEDVKVGRFRKDLYHRLDVVQIQLPPLRLRGSDILKLARWFLQQALSAQPQSSFQSFTPEAEQLLLQYNWPGNVRELQNLIYNVTLLNQGTMITAEMVMTRLQAEEASSPVMLQPSPPPATTSTVNGSSISVELLSNHRLRAFEDIRREVILKAVQHCDGRVLEAAKLLEIGKTTIYRDLQNWKRGE